MDAGKYYALLRFEEASTALRAAFRINLVGEMGTQKIDLAQFRNLFGFTEQGARTFAAILEVMEVLQRSSDGYSVSPRAAATLSADLPTSRRPYLEMGIGDEADALIDMLRGNFPDSSIPLYGRDAGAASTLMDEPNVAREIAYGLASRARNFAEPLAKVISPYANKARILADIGAGSPWVALASAKAMPRLQKIVLVDRSNAMQFAREMAKDLDTANSEFRDQDFFEEVPPADIYIVSNTAHDWLKGEYAKIMTNVRDTMAPDGTVCVHEPLLMSTWNSAAEWVHALWMASYALTLYKLTAGKGTCYTKEEHHEVMETCGFLPVGQSVETSDGCTAIFYKLVADAAALTQGQATQMQSQPATR